MNWKRDILLIPLLIGIVVAIVTYVIPKIAERGKRLSYTIEQPVPYLTRGNVPDVVVIVKGIAAPNLTAQKIRIWNSGGEPLKSLPVLFQYPNAIRVLIATHATVPAQEFGKIDETTTTPNAKRFIYELLNPRDSDTITILTDHPGYPLVFAKAESLEVKSVPLKEGTHWIMYGQIAAFALAVVASLAATLLKSVTDVKHVWPLS